MGGARVSIVIFKLNLDEPHGNFTHGLPVATLLEQKRDAKYVFRLKRTYAEEEPLSQLIYAHLFSTPFHVNKGRSANLKRPEM